MQNQQVNSYFSNEVIRVEPVKLVIQKTNTYNQMYSRPYESNLQYDDLNAVTDRLSRNPTIKVTPGLLSDVASNILRPASIPVGTINISNGWDTPRDKFILIARVTYSSGSVEMHYLQGYTDYHCVGEFSQSIDPNCIFTVNSINKVVITEGHYVNGIKQPEVRRLTAADQIITKTDVGAPTVSMRPVDIINSIETSYMNTALSAAGETTLAYDTRSSLQTMGPSASKRYNNVPSVYLSNLMSTYNGAVNAADDYDSDSDIWRDCSITLNENTVNQNALIKYISRVTNVGFSNWFRYQDLISAFPEIDHITTYVRMSNSDYSFIHSAGSSEFLNHSTREGVAAAMLYQSVPAIMTQCMLNSIKFRTTNNDQLGLITTIIINADSLYTDPNTIGMLLEAFKTRFEKEIFSTISFSNNDLVTLEMSCDLFGDTYINISISGGPMTPYVYPTFCDSLLAPTITNSPNNLAHVSSDMETMLRTCSEIVNSKNKINQIYYGDNANNGTVYGTF